MDADLAFRPSMAGWGSVLSGSAGIRDGNEGDRAVAEVVGRAGARLAQRERHWRRHPPIAESVALQLGLGERDGRFATDARAQASSGQGVLHLEDLALLLNASAGARV